MSCCDYKCDQGKNCPVRQACEMPITMEDEPIFTLQSVLDWIWGALAGVGVVSTLVAGMFLWGYFSK